MRIQVAVSTKPSLHWGRELQADAAAAEGVDVFIFSTLEDVESRTQARFPAAECLCSIRPAYCLPKTAPDPRQLPCTGEVQSTALYCQGAGSGVRAEDTSPDDVHLSLVGHVLHQLGRSYPPTCASSPFMLLCLSTLGPFRFACSWRTNCTPAPCHLW